MKTIIKSSVLALLFAFGCTNKSVEPASVEFSEKIENFMALDVNEQRVIYDAFTDDEKYNIWEYKFSKVLLDQSLTNPQKQLIRALKKEVTKSRFSDEDGKSYLTNIVFKDWLKNAENHFTKLEIYNLVFSLDGYQLKEIPRVVQKSKNMKLALANCHCHVGSAFTCYTTELKFESDGKSLSTSAGGTSHHCNLSNACRELSSGCGFIWAWDCNGDSCS